MNKWLDEYYKRSTKELEDAQSEIERKIFKLEEEATLLIKIKGNTEADFRVAYISERLKQERAAFEKLMRYKKPLTGSLVEKEFKKLASHPKIDKIEVDNNNLILNITTKKLKAFRKNIGHYKIQIGITSALKIENLEYKVGELDHWFISNGNPCLGTWNVAVQKYYDTGHIFLCVDTLIHFLLSTNSEHGHCDAKDWIERFTKRDSSEGIRRQPTMIAADHISAGTLVVADRLVAGEVPVRPLPDPPDVSSPSQRDWARSTQYRYATEYGSASGISNWIYDSSTAAS